METWEYSFPPVSKEDWLKQVERDLKGRSIESLQQEWWPGESLDPFHYTDLVASPVILPGSLFANPPKLISFLGDEVDPIQANQRILSALQCGTQSFHLYSHFNHKQVEQTLKDVIPGVVEWHLYETDTFLSFLKYEPQSFFRTTIDSDIQEDFYFVNRFLKDCSLESFRFEYSMYNLENFVEAGSMLFQNIIDAVEDKSNPFLPDVRAFLNSVILNYHAIPNYLLNIIRIRVLHVIWQNLVLHYTGGHVQNQEYLECKISEVDKAPDEFLIEASSMALGAIIAGAGGICLRQADETEHPVFYQRIFKNISNLLHMESGLPKGKDPLAGAYAIDYYTRLWSERIWNNLRLG